MAGHQTPTKPWQLSCVNGIAAESNSRNIALEQLREWLGANCGVATLFWAKIMVSTSFVLAWWLFTFPYSPSE